MPVHHPPRRAAPLALLLPALFAGLIHIGTPALQSTGAPATSPTPADGSGAYATKKYPNLFAALGHSEREIDAKIDKAWQQLFHGDPETERLFTPAGSNGNGPIAYIPDIQHNDVRGRKECPTG